MLFSELYKIMVDKVLSLVLGEEIAPIASPGSAPVKYTHQSRTSSKKSELISSVGKLVCVWQIILVPTVL